MVADRRIKLSHYFAILSKLLKGLELVLVFTVRENELEMFVMSFTIIWSIFILMSPWIL